jgi:very-short-patch-repair endonuclease
LGNLVSKKYPGLGRLRASITMNRYPDLLKTMGIKSAEIQAQKGFVSKAEKQMREWLPADFFHGKRLGKFVPDFYSPSRKVIIEVDGIYWHSLPKIREKDTFKRAYFHKMGYRLYRFTDADIQKNADFVKLKLKEILSA